MPQRLIRRRRADLPENRAVGGDFARRACKPDSVQGLPPWMTIPLVPPLPTGSSCQPGSLGPKLPCGGIPGCPRTRSRARPLFGVAPGGACRAGPVTSPAVGSYPTVSPLPPRTRAVSSLWRFPWGYPRRTLSGTVASGSPDFPRTSRLAITQPSARVFPRADGGCGSRVEVARSVEA